MSVDKERVYEIMSVDKHSNDDDYVEFVECRQTVMPLPPAHVDAASWMLIQSLQKEEAAATRSKRAATFTATIKGEIKKRYCRDKSARQFLMEDLAEEQRPEHSDYAYALQLKETWDHEEQILVTQPLVRRAETPEQVQDSLDPATALKAYRYAESKARKSHENALIQLQKRVQRLGFSQSKLDECLAYIAQEAPIIIHLTEQTLEKLLADTHFRSLFETNTSGGSNSIPGRETWEHNMFGGCYDKCKPFLRPKYGCLNISGDFRGVQAAMLYGNFVLTLKNDLRFRCTLFDRDTGTFAIKQQSMVLATYQYYAHILQMYPDEELRAALTVSRVSGSPSKCQQYKEVQIHGAIQLDSDIQTLSVPGKQSEASAKLRQLVEAFQEKTKCNILWQGDLLDSRVAFKAPLRSTMTFVCTRSKKN